MIKTELPVVMRSRLAEDLRKLGVRVDDTIMLHASVKAVGWVVGGPDMVIQALFDVLEEKGTLMMYVGWEDSPYHLQSWPRNVQEAYVKECPPFDSSRSRAYHKWSILTEYLRTWPGAYRSGHPEASCAAVGKKAKWLTENHPLQYGYGSGSPLAKLCEAKGKVLLLGAPFSTITLLHYAEHTANVPNKQVVHYRMPLLRNEERVWVDVEEFDTCGNVLPDTDEYFQAIPSDYLKSGRGRTGRVGNAESYLFDADDFVRFAIGWLEAKYEAQR